MRQLDLHAFRVGSAADDIALPLGRSAAGGAGFSSMYGALHAEIRDTIVNGFAPASSTTTLAAAALPSQLSAGSRAWLGAYLAGQSTAMGKVDGMPVDEATRTAFLEDIAPWAERAAAELGVSPHLVVAHAALESNWGRQPVRMHGRNAYNVFGIKAGNLWSGASVASQTTEYVEGRAVRLPQRFRAYDDYSHAFHDYTRLLKDNPRYAGALNAGHDARAFVRGLVQGGYATDVAYEDKLVKVARQIEKMGRIRPGTS
ncbi:glycoside hydrolase family 73 protein [Dyella koreensis]|uniref:Glucosaminidase domain-containing protein n=1 Tax=Dyella koreensis TaxID=311235 RepID=A0ABW8K9K3_9GAMM